MTEPTHEFGRPDPRSHLERLLAGLEQLVREYLPKLPVNTAAVFRQAVDCAALCCHVGDHARVRELLGLALDGAVATFQLASGATRVIVAGREIEYAEATGPSEAADAHFWLEATCIALTLRHDRALTELLAVDREILRQSSTGIDGYRITLVDAVAAVVAGQPASTILAIVREQRSQAGAIGSFDAILHTFIDGLAAIDRRDPSALRDALAALLVAHRSYWGSKRWSRLPEGLISLLGLGLASFAYDHGLAAGFAIDSGYVPRWLVESGEAS